MIQRVFLFVCLVLSLSIWASPVGVNAQSDAPLVLLLTADGPVTPAMVEYLSRGIQLAENRGGGTERDKDEREACDEEERRYHHGCGGAVLPRQLGGRQTRHE